MAVKAAFDAIHHAVAEDALVGNPVTKAREIKVTTYRGTTQLSGFVDNQQMISRASEIAKGVNGVKSVKNDLMVKPS